MNDEITAKLKQIDIFIQGYDYQSALKLCNEVISICDEIQESGGKIKAYQNMVLIFFNKAEYVKSFEYAIEALKLLEGREELGQSLDFYCSFARLFIRHNDYNIAKELLKKNLKIAIKNNNHRYEVVISNLMGFIFCELGQYEIVDEILFYALDIAVNNRYIKNIIEIKMNLAHRYMATGDYDKAKLYLNDAMDQAEELRNFEQIIQGNLLLANIAYDSKDYGKTKQFAKIAETLADKYTFNHELALANKWLHMAYARQGRFEDAYRFLLKYTKITEKIVSNEKERNFSRMRVQYDLYQKEKETTILINKNKKVKKQREELKYLMNVLGKQNDELHSIAIKDYLTGAFNRKYFMMKFEEEFSIAEEYQKELACLVFDIDNFKVINDTYGHLAGDKVIKHIVTQSVDVMGKNAIIGRFGGDEFIILLFNTSIEQAEEIGNTILSRIRTTHVCIGDTLISTTISMGATDNLIGHPKNAEDMIRLADHALYAAKENRRNQLCIANEQTI